jgi:hypothetical protein
MIITNQKFMTYVTNIENIKLETNFIFEKNRLSKEKNLIQYYINYFLITI